MAGDTQVSATLEFAGAVLTPDSDSAMRQVVVGSRLKIHIPGSHSPVFFDVRNVSHDSCPRQRVVIWCA